MFYLFKFPKSGRELFSFIAVFRVTSRFQAKFCLLLLFPKIRKKHLKASGGFLAVDPPSVVTTLVVPFYF
tara:strand:+ start:2938 stop:3147 length:210 start_codon:yes stop_codon:yes gene_type:complete